MPLISGGGGGSAFNGGTITNPLVIALTDPNAVPLSIRASWNAQNTDFFNIVNTDNGIKLVQVDLGGNTLFAAHNDAAQATEAQPGALITTGAGGANGVVLGPAITGLYGHVGAAQPVLVSGTATPEQIALALQSYGAAGGT